MTVNIPTLVSQTITNGVTAYAPSENVVYDALALKEALSAKNTTNGYAGLTGLNIMALDPTGLIISYFDNANLTANRAWLLPDASGTLGLISQSITNGVTSFSPSEDAVYDALALKQATLVSATNIKTINGSSILGSGDLVVSGSSGVTIGTTTITSGTTTRILYNNAGVVGEYTLTGTGTVVAMGTSPTFTTDITSPIVYGSSSSGGALTLRSTSNATKGLINFGSAGTTVYDEVNDRIGIGTATPTSMLHINRNTNDFLYEILVKNNSAGNQAATSQIFFNDVNSQVNVGILGTGNSVYSTYGGGGDGFIRVAGTAAYEGNFNFILNPNSTPTKYFRFFVNTSASASAGVLNLFTNSVGINTYPISSVGLSIIKVTEQLRVGYDTSNYMSTTVGSTGTVTFNAVGAGSKFVFSDNVELTQTVTTEALTSDTSVTVVINGTTYKLLAKA